MIYIYCTAFGCQDLRIRQQQQQKVKSPRQDHDERLLVSTRETASTPLCIFAALTKITTKPLVAYEVSLEAVVCLASAGGMILSSSIFEADGRHLSYNNMVELRISKKLLYFF
jgi:hypothetical protein